MDLKSELGERTFNSTMKYGAYLEVVEWPWSRGSKKRPDDCGASLFAARCDPRADIAQRHYKELVEKDIASVRSDMRSLQSAELQRIEKEMAQVEKRVSL